MARTKSNVSATSTDDEKITVEAVESTTEKIEKSDPKPVEKTEPKSKKVIEEKDFVKIQNPKYALRKVRAIINVYEFDKEGKATVKGNDAEAFLKLPGFAIAD